MRARQSGTCHNGNNNKYYNNIYNVLCPHAHARPRRPYMAWMYRGSVIVARQNICTRRPFVRRTLSITSCNNGTILTATHPRVWSIIIIIVVVVSPHNFVLFHFFSCQRCLFFFVIFRIAHFEGMLKNVYSFVVEGFVPDTASGVFFKLTVRYVNQNTTRPRKNSSIYQEHPHFFVLFCNFSRFYDFRQRFDRWFSNLWHVARYLRCT